MPAVWYVVCSIGCMHVIQSQLINFSYDDQVQKQVKLVRWWLLEPADGQELALPFNPGQESILMKFMEDHPSNFPPAKIAIFDSDSLQPPSLVYEDQEGDIEKPCLLLIRARGHDTVTGICRRMDIVLQNDQLPIQLPFDIAGEIILEKAP